MFDIQGILEFYQKHDKLVIALISIAGTWLFNKFGSDLYSFVTGLIGKLGRRIGGRFSYKEIQSNYLNWVVLQNQDLNLTGLISSGLKPRLEQVFISLKVFNEAREREKGEKVNQPRWSFVSAVSRVFENVFQNVLMLTRYCIKMIAPTRTKAQYDIFQSKRFWAIRQYFVRDGIEFIFVFMLLVLLPSIIILSIDDNQGFFAGLCTLVIVFSIGMGVYSLRDGFGDPDAWMFAMLFTGLPATTITYVVYSRILIQRQSPLALLIGFVLGLISVIVIIFRMNRSRVYQFEDREIIADEVGELLSKYDNIAILGKPGAGKSTFVQFIALTFAQEKAGEKNFRHPKVVKRRFGIRRWFLPILIPLRNVSSTIAQASSNSSVNVLFDAFRNDILPSEIRSLFTDGYIRQMLKKKRCLFLLDGLDEVANDIEFKAIVNEIKGLVSQYSGNKFIVTSRYSGWRGGVSSTFIQTEVNDLNISQINTFVDCWYQAIEKNRSFFKLENESSEERRFREQKARDKAENLKSALKTIENIRNLAKNPLLLSLICYVHYNKTLPKERLSLYRDCSNLLLDQWDVEKGLPQEDIPLNLARKEIIMQEIAFSFHCGRMASGIEKKEATSDEIIPIIQKVLRKFGIDISQAEILFQKLINRTGIIVTTEKYKDLYGFSHLTFQEFYTAGYIHANKLDIVDVIQEANDEERDDPINWEWWREVMLLYAGMQKDVTPLISKLSQNDASDLLMTKLQIAAQCLAEAIETPQKSVEGQLLNQLLSIRLDKATVYGDKPLPVELKHYLARFVTSSDFYKRILLKKIQGVTSTEDAEKLADSMMKIIESGDVVVKPAALQVLLELERVGNIKNFIQRDVATRILMNSDFSMQLALIQHIATRLLEQPNSDVFSLVLEQCGKMVVNQALKRDAKEFGSLNKICQILRELTSDVFKTHHALLRERLTSNLFNFFNTHFGFFYSNIISELSLINSLNCMMECLSQLDDHEQRVVHRRQLLEMLSMGDFDQQAWAIFALQAFDTSDGEILNAIMKKIKTPSLKTRLSAIWVLRRLELDPLSLESTKRILRYAIKKKSRLTQWQAQFFQALLGQGALGIDTLERIHIAGTLFVLNNYSDDGRIIDDLISEYEDASFLEVCQWIYLFMDLQGKFDILDLDKLLSWYEVFLLRTTNINSLMTVSTNKAFLPIDGELRKKLTSILFEILDKKPHAIYPLKELLLNIEVNSPEHFLLLHVLAAENYDIANAAFEILVHNKLI